MSRVDAYEAAANLIKTQLISNYGAFEASADLSQSYPLKIAKCQHKELISSIETLFQTEQVILASGFAGSGKTTYIRSYCYHWSLNVQSYSSITHMFYIDLSEFVGDNLLLEVERLLLKCSIEKTFLKQVLLYSDTTLLIFDHFEQLSDQFVNVKNLILNPSSWCSKFLIIMRSDCMNKFYDFDVMIQVEGFSVDVAYRYFLKANLDHNTILALMKTFPQLVMLPLMCQHLILSVKEWGLFAIDRMVADLLHRVQAASMSRRQLLATDKDALSTAENLVFHSLSNVNPTGNLFRFENVKIQSSSNEDVKQYLDYGLLMTQYEYGADLKWKQRSIAHDGVLPYLAANTVYKLMIPQLESSESKESQSLLLHMQEQIQGNLPYLLHSIDVYSLIEALKTENVLSIDEVTRLKQMEPTGCRYELIQTVKLFTSIQWQLFINCLRETDQAQIARLVKGEFHNLASASAEERQININLGEYITAHCDNFKEFCSGTMENATISDDFCELIVHKLDSTSVESVTAVIDRVVCNNEFRLFLVRGDPGIGKTTFVSKIAHEWATGRNVTMRQHFDFVFVFNAAKLVSDEELLLAARNMVGYSCSKAILIATLFYNPRTLLIFDDFSDNDRSDSIVNVLRANEYGTFRTKIILTTRSTNELTSDIEIIIKGFETQVAAAFIRHWLRNDKAVPDDLIIVNNILKIPFFATLFVILKLRIDFDTHQELSIERMFEAWNYLQKKHSCFSIPTDRYIAEVFQHYLGRSIALTSSKSSHDYDTLKFISHTSVQQIQDHLLPLKSLTIEKCDFNVLYYLLCQLKAGNYSISCAIQKLTDLKFVRYFPNVKENELLRFADSAFSGFFIRIDGLISEIKKPDFAALWCVVEITLQSLFDETQLRFLAPTAEMRNWLKDKQCYCYNSNEDERIVYFVSSNARSPSPRSSLYSKNAFNLADALCSMGVSQYLRQQFEQIFESGFNLDAKIICRSCLSNIFQFQIVYIFNLIPKGHQDPTITTIFRMQFPHQHCFKRIALRFLRSLSSKCRQFRRFSSYFHVVLLQTFTLKIIVHPPTKSGATETDNAYDDTPSPIIDCPFYHPNMRRENAEQLLIEIGKVSSIIAEPMSRVFTLCR